jgi:hypothetical protein
MNGNRVPPSDVKLILLDLLFKRVRRFTLGGASGTVVRREPPKLLAWGDAETRADEIRALVAAARENDARAWSKLTVVNGLVQRVLDAPTAALAGLFSELERLAGTWGSTAAEPGDVEAKSSFVATGERGGFAATVDIEHDGQTLDRLRREREDQEFLAAVARMSAERRASNSPLTPRDEAVVERAYQLIDRGARVPVGFQSVRTDARRPHQTYLSFADPGDGHLEVTVRDDTLLRGLIVHIEYIDRDGVNDKSLVEAYRLPALRNAARVRLNVGDAAPCTAFIGRPIFEGGNFELGLLKAVHTTAGVCSAMFAVGVADCKVAMDGMTAAQCARFMRAVAGNVVRNPLLQRLSAAFNINATLRDDRDGRRPHDVTGPLAVANLGIDLARAGRFNKVAWDGASDVQPSRPIIGQLSRVELFGLVHRAHGLGLETYISAGMRARHMADAAFTGVGGVGIGTSLHFRDARSNAIGEIDPRLVLETLAVRDRAAATTAGRAAAALAQLDWAHARRPADALASLRDRLAGPHERFLATYEALADQLPEYRPPDPTPAAPPPAPPDAEARAAVEAAMRKVAEDVDYGGALEQAEALIEKLRREPEVLERGSAAGGAVVSRHAPADDAPRPDREERAARELVEQFLAIDELAGGAGSPDAGLADEVRRLAGAGDWTALAEILRP